jgi:hypothetical protein
MCNFQITQQFRWLGVLLIMILHVWPVNQPTIIIVALCTKQTPKNLDTPALEDEQKKAGIT